MQLFRSIVLTISLIAAFFAAPLSQAAPKPADLSSFAYDSTQPVTSTILSLSSYQGIRMLKLTYSGGHGDPVPGLLVEPPTVSQSHPAPCVLFIHWLGGQKEQMLPIARLAAQQGYASLLIDLPGFGERKPTRQPVFTSADELTGFLNSEFTSSVVDLRRGIDYLQARPEIDTSKIALCGISLGGFIGVDLAAADPRIKAAALIATGGGLGEILTFQAAKRSSYGQQYAPLILSATPSQLEQRLLAVDPLTNIAAISPRPLLMENGDADAIVPPSAARRLYAAAGQPKHIDWYHDEGHMPSPLELYAALTPFLQRNLSTKLTKQ